MSRCFPYPPPGYSRNGATYEALIESIKLQKETDTAKAERKKEKRARKEKKKGKEKRKDEEKGKLQKNPNDQLDAHKVLQSSVDFKEAHNKKREPSVEQLEKSDLTEEHFQPIGSHKPSYSSDSTQNSNKRKRDAAICPEGSSGNGKPIKIRLLKKHQGPDSSKETLSSNSVHGLQASLVSSNRKTSLPATSVTEDKSVQGIRLSQQKSTPNFGRPGTKTNDAHGLHFSRKQSAPTSGIQILPSSHLKHEIPSSNSNKMERPTPSGRPVLPLSHEIPNSNSITAPASSGSKRIDLQGFCSGREQSTPSSGRPFLPPNHLTQGISYPDSNKTMATASLKRSIGEIPVPGNSNVMGFEEKMKGPIGEIPIPVDSNIENAGPTRFEKKMRKKHSKYEKLIGSWVPPVLQTQLPDDGDDDQDWLSRSGKMGRSSRGDVDTCREYAASSLWRPCAQFLPETNIYALPYTVPF